MKRACFSACRPFDTRSLSRASPPFDSRDDGRHQLTLLSANEYTWSPRTHYFVCLGHGRENLHTESRSPKRQGAIDRRIASPARREAEPLLCMMLCMSEDEASISEHERFPGENECNSESSVRHHRLYMKMDSGGIMQPDSTQTVLSNANLH